MMCVHDKKQLKLKCQTVVVLLPTILERLNHDHHEIETPAQTDVLLYLSHKLLMVGILEEVCPLHRPHLLLPEALQYTPVCL